MTFLKFDGSKALAWLTQENHYFLVKKTPPSRPVDLAIVAISEPAMPWLKLLHMRYSSFSWDKFMQELLRRFGDTIPPESRVTCNSSKVRHALFQISAQPISDIPIAATCVAKNQPKISPTPNDNTAVVLPSLPTMTAPLLSSTQPTIAMVTAPLLSPSPHSLQI